MQDERTVVSRLLGDHLTTARTPWELLKYPVRIKLQRAGVWTTVFEARDAADLEYRLGARLLAAR